MRPFWLALAAAAWMVFIIWTLRRLGACSAREGQITSYYGVRWLGVGMWLFMTCAGVILSWQINPHRPVWYYAFAFAFIFLPICLWAGFVWGKAMSGLFPPRSNR
jgi:hypothetical protein